MYQAPTSVWNEIAASQPLSQPWANLFRMDLEQLTRALGKIEKDLESKGVDARTIRAYLLTAPLLVENEAVSSFIQDMNRPELRASMPEICSVNEAMMLASAEYRLSQSQQARLSKLLHKAMSDSLHNSAQPQV